MQRVYFVAVFNNHARVYQARQVIYHVILSIAMNTTTKYKNI